MPLEVIGAGFGRTGTASLKQALEELGSVKSHHMSEVLGDSRQAVWWDRASRGEAVNWLPLLLATILIGILIVWLA